MKRIVLLLFSFFVLLLPLEAVAKPVDLAVIQKIATYWIKSNAVFKKAVKDNAQLSYRIEKISKIALDGVDYPAYALDLTPRGYLIIFADDELPTIISYSAESRLDLSDKDNNSFRKILERDIKGSQKALTNYLDRDSIQFREKNRNRWKKYRSVSGVETTVLTRDYDVLFDLPLQSVVIVDELMQTRWNQNNHYNELTPESDEGIAGTPYYDGHAPTGCVATAFSQLMKYHNWPWYAEGGHSYSDASGTITGDHAVSFADAYDWAQMQDEYDPWSLEPTAAVAAVAELMYETGVAVEMNYEPDGSSSSPLLLQKKLASQFYYQYAPAVSYSASEMTDALVQNLAERTPCVASIPGHAVVADGHSTEGSDHYFHINYGWGGDNNGWYLLNAVPGGGVTEVYPGSRPREIPLLVGTAFGGGNLLLDWKFPEYFQDEVQDVRLFEGQMSFVETVFDSADNFDLWQPLNAWSDLWEIENGRFHWAAVSDSGDWSNGPNPVEFLFPIIPDATTRLTFDVDATLADEWFGVEISTDRGESWQVLRSWTDTGGGGISESCSVDLSAYAGVEILVRFNAIFSSGSYYPTGGVWLDNIELTNIQQVVFQEKTVDLTIDLTSQRIEVFSLTAGTLYYSAQVFQGDRWSERSPMVSLVNTIDTTPDPFSFTDQNAVPLNTAIVSNEVTINGIDLEAPISISGGEYSVAGGLFTSSPGVISTGLSVRVRVLSAADYSTTRSAVLTVGGVSDTFSVSTFGEELDVDRDGLADFEDNCPALANPDQLDVNGDGLGNACDDVSDSDSDGLTDAEEFACGSDPLDGNSVCSRAMPWLMLLLDED